MRGIKLYRRNIKAESERFYCENGAKIEELLERCKRCQGEYIPAGHGPGSWATTYSLEFIAAATELYELCRHSKLGLPELMLSQAFRSAEVRSCRGRPMTVDIVEYLYENHIKLRVDGAH